MNIADELAKLHELHRAGAISSSEYATAKAAVLSGNASDTESSTNASVQAQLDELQLQNRIARLDREWELERQQYMVSGKYGQRHIPKQETSILVGSVIVVFGIFWTGFTASASRGFNHGFSFFPLFGVLFILIGVGTSINGYKKAGQYERANEAYLRNRSRLLSEGTDSPGLSPESEE